MPTVIFTAGAKGGTGKSTAARFMISCLRARGADPLMLDMDDENKTLLRFFPDAVDVEIRKKSSHDVLVERALANHKLIVADLKAGTGREVLDWWLDVPFEELDSAGVKFVCAASVTSSPDSVHSFLNWADALKDRVKYIVFKNFKDGDFLPDYDEAVDALQFRAEYFPHHVVLPRMDEEYVTELERFNLIIPDVLDAVDGMSPRGRKIGTLLDRLMVRARLRRYQQEVYDQLNPIFESLEL